MIEVADDERRIDSGAWLLGWGSIELPADETPGSKNATSSDPLGAKVSGFVGTPRDAGPYDRLASERLRETAAGSGD